MQAQLVSEAMQLKMALLVARPIMEAAMADEWAPEASNANVGMQPAVDGSCPDDIWWQVRLHSCRSSLDDQHCIRNAATSPDTRCCCEAR